MLHLTELELENYGPFKGKHRIKLEPGVYAVTAAREGDAEESNGIGKSFFLSAIPFGLIGWHMADSEDGFISDGCKTAAVRHILSDGTCIERARKKTTQLLVKLPGRGEQKGAAAQQALLEHLGIAGEKDYFATSFFEQKKISRLVTMGSTERQELVRSWLDLEPLEACEQLAWDIAKQEKEAADALGLLDKAVELHWENVARRFFPEGQATLGVEERDELLGMIANLAEPAVALAELALQRAAGDYGHNLQVEAALRFKEIQAEGVRLRAAFDAMPEVTELQERQALLKADALTQEFGAASAEHKQALQAAHGRFDGKCPVAGIACPAKEQINSGADEAEAHAQAMTERANALIKPKHEADVLVDQLSRQRRERAQAESRLQVLREQAAKALQGFQGEADAVIAGEPQAGEQSPAERLREAKATLAQAQGLLALMQEAIKDGDRLEARRATAEQLQAAGRKVTAARATAKIYRRAQRLVAERNMGEVEQQANASLTSIGSRLQVQLSWSREGADLATSCEDCGGAFPKSAKAKTCEWCGAKRGLSQIDRLDVALSDWSGGLEDLAGVVVQLAATSWLRNRKGMRWASACIDEPFGALDAKNRRELAGQLGQLLRDRSGFQQAFVVAHDRGIMQALSQRIEFVGGAGGTRFA